MPHKDPARKRETERAYKTAHPALIRESAARYRRKHRTELRRKGKIYGVTHREQHSANLRRYRYGLTEEQYQALIQSQAQSCALCGEVFVIGKPIYVDHDHRSGKVRGLLHPKCNTLLGVAGDSIARLELAIKYLKLGQ